MTNPLVSVIIPVYNAGKYLAETLDSVIAQDIGFKDNIEIILVNDGSTDNSEEICKSYQSKYPNNITYIKQKNAGVSAARNRGIKQAGGEYVNFLDSDDKWSSDAFRKSISFLEKYKGDVDFVASKILFFGSINGSHPNNYKFKKSRVINVDNDPDNPIFHNPTCIYRTEAIRGVEFDTKLKISEDVKFISEVLFKKKAYGVLEGPSYYYRKRGDETSAIGGSLGNKAYYLDTPKHAYMPMLDIWRDENGRVYKYMQYTILSDLRWRIPQSSQNVLTDEELKIYKQTIYKIIKEIDEDVIKKQRGYLPAVRAFMLDKNNVRLNPLELTHRLPRVYLDFITYEGNGRMFIEGYLEPGIDSFLPLIKIRTKYGEFKLSPKSRVQRSITFLGDIISGGAAFEATIKLRTKDKLEFVLETENGKAKKLKLRPKQFTGLSELNLSYRKKDYLFIRRIGKSIYSKPIKKWRRFLYETAYLLRLLFNWNIKIAVGSIIDIYKRRHQIRAMSKPAIVKLLSKPVLAVIEALLTIPKAIILRLAYFMTLPFINKPVWIINDRSNSGRDNGEAFYRYLLDINFQKADYYFLISKNTPDYKRIKSYGGKVLKQGGLKHFLKFLQADKIISAHADTEVTNPFWRQLNHYVDLFDFDFIFLQHGIIYNNLSGWLNRYEKNIKLFITSTKDEREAILTYPYYYDKTTVLLSGLPRHDMLENIASEKLIIMPTNRKPLLPPTNKLGQRKYNPEFRNSEYFKFYNELINDDNLKNALKTAGMIGEFYIHPAHIAQLEDFMQNEVIKLARFPYDYNKALCEGSVMLTDYSSVSFDFSYLKKPVVYTNFDIDEFHKSQIYDPSEHFQLENDGFGPVVYNYDDTIKELVKIINNGCKIESKYRERAEAYFAHHDGNNRKRVFDAIMELDKRKK